MSDYCVIDEFFNQLDEMKELVAQIPDTELRERLAAVHAHMHKVVRIGERAALDLEKGIRHACVHVPRSELKRKQDTYKLDYEAKTN